MFRYLPEQASEIAPKIDFINNLITDLSVFFTVAIVGAMLYFAIKYRQRGGVDHETPQIRGSHFLEMVWTVMPTVICVFLGYYGVAYFREMRHVPDNSLEVNVKAQKWQWSFEYQRPDKSGKVIANRFVVPVDQDIKLVMTSKDVIHGFFVPSMRVKADVLPGTYTYLHFKPIKTGEYQVFCTHYCGDEHSHMLAKVDVVSQAEYDRWLNDKSDEIKMASMAPAELGKKLFTEKACIGCHSLSGAPMAGPTWLKLFNSEVDLLDGTKVKADENYLRESILNPNAQIVKGFGPKSVMPAFEGQLKDNEVDGLIAFIKTIDGSQVDTKAAAPAKDDKPAGEMTAVDRGQKIYKEKLCITCHSLDGSKVVGPTFKGVYGKTEKIQGGSTVTVDDAYIKESIYEPAAKVVDGFPPAMPPFKGMLSDADVADVIEFLKTVK